MPGSQQVRQVALLVDVVPTGSGDSEALALSAIR